MRKIIFPPKILGEWSNENFCCLKLAEWWFNELHLKKFEFQNILRSLCRGVWEKIILPITFFRGVVERKFLLVEPGRMVV